MKRIRKNICLALSLMLALSVMLTGCQSSESSVTSEQKGSESRESSVTSEQKGSEVTSEKKESESLEPVTLLLYGVGDTGPNQEKVYEKANEYLKEKINCTVKFNIYDWGSYDTKMQMLLATGEPIDLCYTASWINNYITNATNGAFLPLDDLLKTYAPKTYAHVEPKELWNGLRINGKIYGVLNYQLFAMQNGIYFNKNLTDKYNFDWKSVKNLSDLEPMLKEIKEKEKGISPLEITSSNTVEALRFSLNYNQFLSQVPAAISNDNDSLQVFNLYDTQEFKDLLATIRKYYLAGYINGDALTDSDITDNQKAQNFFANVSSFDINVDADNVSISTKNNTGFSMYASGISKGILTTAAVQASCCAIPSTSQNPERAMMFIDLMQTDPYLLNLLDFGIEGEDYTKNSDGAITTNSPTTYGNIGWLFGNDLIKYKYANASGDTASKSVESNKSASVSPAFGFSTDTSVISTKIAACKSAYEEYMPKLLCGMADPDTGLKQYMKALDAAGYNDLQKVIQYQLNKWAEEKQ